MDAYQIMVTFNINNLALLQHNLNDCSTSFEHSILNIIELVAECGSQMKLDRYDHYDDDNRIKSPLYYEMKKSGLIGKIESILFYNIN